MQKINDEIEIAEFTQDKDGLKRLIGKKNRHKILTDAKNFNLFQKNKYSKTREIIISEEEYQKL